MDADLDGLRERLKVAENHVGRMTNLMLRTVWQNIVRRCSQCSAAGAGTSAKPCRIKPSAGQVLGQRGEVACQPSGKRRGAAIDQAKLSRRIHRAAFEAALRHVQEQENTLQSEVDGQGTDNESVDSVALILLRAARDRAIALVVFLRFRLSVLSQRRLHEECEERFSYYLMRRALRAWYLAAKGLLYERYRQILCVVEHWRAICHRQKQIRSYLQPFRTGLSVRYRAFNIVLSRKLLRCFSRWVYRLELRRLIISLEERAQEMRKKRAFTSLGSSSFRPSPFNIKNSVFTHWKEKTERRLDEKLAEFMGNKSLKREVWITFSSRYAARQSRNEDARRGVGDRSSPAVHVEPLPEGLMLYKTQCAQQIAQGILKGSVFSKWRSVYRGRLCDRFFVYHRCLHVMRLWLLALRRRRLSSFILTECWQRWRRRFLCRVRYTCADNWRRYNDLHKPFTCWYRYATALRVRRCFAARSCLQNWHRNTMFRIAQTRSRASTRRHLFFFWQRKTSRTVKERTSLCVADSIRELVLLLGCFRRWRYRYEGVCRVHLSESILEDLRRERQRSYLFQRWKRMTVSLRGTDSGVGETVGLII